LKSYVPSDMKVGRAIEARLQTAVSSGAEYSMISVHKFHEWSPGFNLWLQNGVPIDANDKQKVGDPGV
jgi:hypothetical protein